MSACAHKRHFQRASKLVHVFVSNMETHVSHQITGRVKIVANKNLLRILGGSNTEGAR
jgi:hypothetical protein